MKNTLQLTLAALTLGAASASAQFTIAYWDQNSNALPGGGFGFTPASFPQSADVGSGTLTLGNFLTETSGVDSAYTYIQSFGGSTVNAIGGASGGGSFSPQGGLDNGNNGMYFDLNVSTAGFSGITLSWAQRGTNSGFDSRQLSYSVDGISFTDFGSDTGILGSSFTLQSYDLTAITALDNQPSVTFRVTLDGATGATGNNRFDNILVTAAVPEPSTYAALIGALALGLVIYRRRKA